MATVFVSHAIGAQRLYGSSAGSGAPAWDALAQRYLSGLAASGLAAAELARPEIYQAAVAREILGAGLGAWHLAVKPPPDLRRFPGLPNVFVTDGQDLAAHAPGPFGDPVRMLGMADIVAGTDDRACQAAHDAGLAAVVRLSPATGAFAGDLARLAAMLQGLPR